jgi:hypothetical protein
MNTPNYPRLAVPVTGPGTVTPPHIIYGPIPAPGSGTTAPAPHQHQTRTPAGVASRIKHPLAPGLHWQPRPWV